MPNDATLLTAAEVGRRLAVDRGTVTRWAKRGLIEGVLLPSGVWRFPESEVDRLLTVQPARSERHAS